MSKDDIRQHLDVGVVNKRQTLSHQARSQKLRADLGLDSFVADPTKVSSQQLQGHCASLLSGARTMRMIETTCRIRPNASIIHPTICGSIAVLLETAAKQIDLLTLILEQNNLAE